MTKKWTEEDVDFALGSAWSAFCNTLKAHGVTEEEIFNLFVAADASIDKLNDYFGQVITWEEE